MKVCSFPDDLEEVKGISVENAFVAEKVPYLKDCSVVAATYQRI